MEERRQTVRVDLNVGVSVRVDAHKGVQRALSSRALNSEGIQLLLPARVPPKEQVELELSIPSQPSPLKVSGQVAWVEHLGDVYEGFYMVGIRFLELADSARQVIEKLIEEELRNLHPLPSEE